jgi:hypothetical protein
MRMGTRRTRIVPKYGTKKEFSRELHEFARIRFVKIRVIRG